MGLRAHARCSPRTSAHDPLPLTPAPLLSRSRSLSFARIYAGGVVVAASTDDASSSATGSFITAGGLGVAKKAYVGTEFVVEGTTDASSSTAAATMLHGGLSVALKVSVSRICAARVKKRRRRAGRNEVALRALHSHLLAGESLEEPA